MEANVITAWNLFCLVMVFLYVRYDIKRNED
jgi:hypothetical protein